MRTGADGLVRSPPVAPVRYEVTLQAPGHPDGTARVDLAAAGRAAVTPAERRGSRRDDVEVGERLVTLARLETGGDGRFALDAAPAEDLLLCTEVPHHRNLSAHAVRIAPGARTSLGELTLEASGELVFHLRRRPGMAVPSATEVRVLEPQTDRLLTEHRFAPGERPQLTGLAAGPLELLVRTADGHEARARAHVAEGATRTVVVSF